MGMARTRAKIGSAPTTRVVDSKSSIRQLKTFLPVTTPQQTNAGITVDSTKALGIPAFYQAVALISEAISQARFSIVRSVDGRDEEEYPIHPLMDIFDGGVNPWMTWPEYVEATITSLLIWGYSCSYIRFDSAGYPVSLIPIRPELIRFLQRKDKPLLIPELDHDASKQLEFAVFEDFQYVKYPADRILYIKGKTIDGILPVSPTQIFKEVLGLNVAAKRFGSVAFSEDATPKLVLETDEMIIGEPVQKVNDDGDPVFDSQGNEIYQDRGETIEEQWNKLGTRGMALLDGGLHANYIAMPAEDRQFLETQGFGVREIARIFNVPPTMLGDDAASTYNNDKTQDMTFVRNTLGPIARKLEATLTKQLIASTRRTKIRVKVDVQYQINETSEELTKRTVQAYRSGLLGIGEARSQLGFTESVPDGDFLFGENPARLTVEPRPALVGAE